MSKTETVKFVASIFLLCPSASLLLKLLAFSLHTICVMKLHKRRNILLYMYLALSALTAKDRICL